ncbi:hypothetical protein LUZ60_006790 [Juncus effusus]|nr:hypothetical protein LUZ60_006790 [Juncus effusus]
MADESQAKTPSLQEQYSLVEKEEKSDKNESSEVKPSTEEEIKIDAIQEEEVPETTEETVVETVTEEEKLPEATEEPAEEPEPEEEKPEIKIETAPADFRFPTTNQTRHCFTRYVEYHKCVAAKGEDASECDKFAKYYRSLCPSEWVERWNEQRENGTFPGPL